MGWVAYVALVLFAGAVPAFQVVRHAVFPPAPQGPAPFSTCRDGLHALYAAIERGREAARLANESGDSRSGEETALQRYREAVEPTWRYRDQVQALCRSAPGQEGALDAIERLRYAEEHGVRSQAEELSSLRRRVRQIVQQSL